MVIVTFVSATFILLYSSPPEVREYEIYLTVGSYVGFNVNSSALFFGTITAGGTGSREIIVNNHGALPRKVQVETSGNLSDWVKVSDNNFVLQGYENKSLEVNATVPEDAEFGNYTGILKLIFKKSI